MTLFLLLQSGTQAVPRIALNQNLACVSNDTIEVVFPAIDLGVYPVVQVLCTLRCALSSSQPDFWSSK